LTGFTLEIEETFVWCSICRRW